MADEDSGEDLEIMPSALVEIAKATRAARLEDDAAMRERWLVERAAEGAKVEAKAAARNRIRAAAHSGRPVDPADVALALE